jgi:NitT/TauT family transport system substrate-binding protein
MAAFVLAVFAGTAGGGTGACAADPVKVTYASFDALYAPYFIGIEKGYFAQQDLEVALVQAGGGTATPALMSGSVQFSSSSGSAVSAIIRGARLKVVMTLAVSLPWKLWATGPDIKTVQDLKGKPVGVETLGGLDELAMRAVLMKAGLSQDWVAYSPVGVGGVQRIAIMKYASMPAIFLSYIEEKMARSSGALANGHVLIDFPKEIQIPYNGLATSQSLIDANPGLVARFVRGVVMGMRYMRAYPKGTLAVLEKMATNTPAEQLSESLDETGPTVIASGEAALPLRQFDLKLRSTILGMAATDAPPPEKVYDYSFVEKAVAALDDSQWRPVE